MKFLATTTIILIVFLLAVLVHVSKPTRNRIASGNMPSATHFDYNGHAYIRIEYRGCRSIIHDPDCPCITGHIHLLPILLHRTL